MEGLPQRVCDLFYEAAAVHQGRRGRSLAQSMTEVSGIGALLPVAAVVDDWAFEPCGYSMNASHEHYYYTIHITPEFAFSYASFETNDPAYRKPEHVAAIVKVFSPALLNVTLTTRTSCGLDAVGELPVYAIDGLPCTSREHHALTSAVSVCCINFGKDASLDQSKSARRAMLCKAKAQAASPVDEASTGGEASIGEGSEASSDDTLGLAEL